MRIELQPTKLGAVSTSWEEMAPRASVDFRLGRKAHAFEEFRQGIGHRSIHTQSTTKRKAVRFRRSWETPATPKLPCDLSRLEFRAWNTGMIVFLPPWVARQVKMQPVATEVFRGRVDDISDGTACVTLFSKDEEPITAQWPEQDLAKQSIGKGDLFELTMTDTGSAVLPSFRKVPRKPIPDELWKEIERVKAAYSDLQADHVDGDEEG